MLLTATVAQAKPLDDKRAQALAVKRQMDRLDVKLEVAAEDYNEAYGRYQSVTTRVRKTEAKLSRVRKRIGTLQTRLGTRAENMYRSGPTQFLEMLLGAADFEQLASTWDLLTDMSRTDADAVGELKVSKRLAQATERELKKQQAQARASLNVMADRKSRIADDLAARRRLLSGVEREIASLEAQQEAAARAAASALTKRRFTPVSRGDFGTPSRSPRSAVVSIAMRYLGYPYRWGAAGPNAFDCSGLTMYVYAQVGVSLPHSSRAQFGSGERVSRANLAPGDLVFFGSPIHHVGIYVGGGQFIHAPRTGDVVKISPLDRLDYVGAVRP